MDKSFFIDNRREFAMKLPNKCAAFIFAGENKAMSGDTDYRFLPDRNFYYLTGLHINEVILMIVRDTRFDEGFEVTLFAKEKNKLKERWTGKRQTFEELQELTGIQRIESLEGADEVILEVLREPEIKIALDGSSIMEGPRELRKKIASYRSDEPLDVSDTFIRMRMVKKPCEIEAIRESAKITEKAVKFMKETMSSLKEIDEYQMYTSLEYGMARQGSLIPAFETIVAVDDNVFYLHHSDPELGKTLKHGQLIQLDLGARVDGYCADISRAIYAINPDLPLDPVKDERVHKLHSLIVKLRRTVYEEVKPGINFSKLNLIVRKVCGDWLVTEGLLDVDYTDEDVKRYYWHNTGHHLGLDVHDVCIKDMPFVEGNVLAIEPGVYIEEWGIGFRIEDDILVTKDGCELLSSGTDDLEDFIFESGSVN